jgi:hypothetical protein
VADEPISALDVSIQAQVVNLSTVIWEMNTLCPFILPTPSAYSRFAQGDGQFASALSISLFNLDFSSWKMLKDSPLELLLNL